MTPPARVCLNMIVKDESAIIARCLASVLPLIDHYVVCDTGSSDDTPDRIIAFFAGHGIPGELHRTPFVDFSASRNRALELCRQSPGDFSYLLLVDADMELVLEDPDLKSHLVAPSYSIRQSNRLSYDNVRLIRRDLPARYLGVTHEYLEIAVPPVKLTGVWFRDHACGANRAGKSSRDIELLEAALTREPGDRRAMFYLAQSYRDSGATAAAIDGYRRRIAAGGWSEEVWYSRYMLACCLLDAGREAEFVRECLAAYDERPSRAEPLCRLASYYRQRGMHEACLLMCEAGERIPYPQSDALFVEDHAYHTGFAQEAGISGYYCASPQRRQRGYEACLALAVSRSVDEPTRRTARYNSRYYARSAAELFGAGDLREIGITPGPPYSPTNPSIWGHDGTVYGVVRAVNYTIVDGAYQIHDGSGIIRSRNFFVRFDRDLAVAETREILGREAAPPGCGFPVVGFEDCRLFFHRGRFWCSATVRHLDPSGRCEIALLELAADGRVTSLTVERTVHPDRHQKNWVPLIRGEELFFVYLADPTTVLACDVETRETRIVSEKAPSLALDHLRGGSQAVPVAGGWLYLTHEVLSGSPTAPVYFHRFVWLTADFAVGAVSDPFYFEHKGIEFCAGVVIDEAGGRLIASVGLGDRRAVLVPLPLAAVLAHLGLN